MGKETNRDLLNGPTKNPGVSGWFMRGEMIGLTLGLGVGLFFGFLLWALNEPFFGKEVALISAASILLVITLAFSITLGLVFGIVAALVKIAGNYMSSIPPVETVV
jgi:hypothetical protein